MQTFHPTRWLVVLGLILAMAIPADAQGGAPAPETDVSVTEEADTETIAAGTEDEAPMTMGEAFVRKLAQGGLTMLFLALASVAALASAIERLTHQRRSAIVPNHLAARADTLYKQQQYDQLIREAEADGSTLGRMIAAITRHRGSGSDSVSQIAGDIAARDLKRHLQRAYPMAVVATLAPLMGLLGTVIGMIGAFDTVAAMGSLGDASMLGGDISKALVTTGAGLAIAIPALACYHWFKSRVQYYAIDLEETASELVAGWFLEPATPPSPKPGEAATIEQDTPTAKPTAVTDPTPDTATQEQANAD